MPCYNRLPVPIKESHVGQLLVHALVREDLKLGGEKTADPVIVLWVFHPAIWIEGNQRMDSPASVFYAKLHTREDEDSFLRPQSA